MASSGIHRIKEKKCATCSYWSGDREIQFTANKPHYVKTVAGSFKCLANKNKTTTAVTYCLKWRL